VKSLIVGSLMLFGTFLVVLGSSLLDSVEASMERTIVSSLAGHLQLYDAKAKDDLALFGGAMMGGDDVGKIDNYAELKKILAQDPLVKASIPMGLTQVTVNQPSELDEILASMRAALREKSLAQLPEMKEQVRTIAQDLVADYERSRPLSADQSKIDEALKVLGLVTSDRYWELFDEHPEQSLDELDLKLAPLAEDGQMLWLRVLGTDLSAFAKNFDRMKLDQGTLPPRGRRGLVLSKRFYEKQAKHKVARELDALMEGVTQKGLTLKDDPGLADRAKRLPGQYQRILHELSPKEGQALKQELLELLRDEEPEEAAPTLSELLKRFLTLDDESLSARSDWFYEHIAPRIKLYPVKLGEQLTLRSFTKTGYLKAVNVPVWGIFDFEGLENSDMAGSQNLLDLITFRELYGIMTTTVQAELSSIKQEVGLEDVSAAEAEDALFGEGAETELMAAGELDAPAQAGAADFDEFKGISMQRGEGASSIDEHVYSQEEIDKGLALSVAVIAENPSQLESLKASLQARFSAPPLELKVVNWQEASGLVGQFLWVVRAVLYLAIFFIFAVALFIINNSMVIATLERVPEIGTLRAIGAQRSFVTGLVLLETLSLGFLSGGLGAGLATLLLKWLGNVGISASGVDILVFLFSGPRLYPFVTMTHLLLGVGSILVVSLISTFYPAWIAVRVPPVVAMSAGE